MVKKRSMGPAPSVRAAASGVPEEAMRYLYSHDFEGAYVPQAYLPEGRIYYQPGEQGHEKRVKERLDHWRSLMESSGPTPDKPPL